MEQTIAGICKVRKTPNFIRFNTGANVLGSVEFDVFDDIFNVVVLLNINQSMNETN